MPKVRAESAPWGASSYLSQAEDADTARVELNSLLKSFEKRANEAIELVDSSFDDATAILTRNTIVNAFE